MERQDKGEVMTSNGISIHFQSTTLLITTAIILYFVAGQVFHFCAVDKRPTLYPLSALPAQTAAKQPAHVSVGLTITDFSEFNVSENVFKIAGIISFAYDPKQISAETIDHFAFLRGEIKHKSLARTIKVGNKVLAYYTIKVTFKTNLYYGFFPFEDHTIFLGIINTAASPHELVFDASRADFIIDKDVYVSGWSYQEHRVQSGYNETKLSAGNIEKTITTPGALFMIDYFHNNMSYIISIMLPLLIIFFIDLFSFCLDQRQQRSTLIQMSTGNIVALVAYRFVIESFSPKVGYPMISDYIFFLFLSISFSVFLLNAIGPYLKRWQKKMISVGIQLVVVGVFAALLAFWIPC